MLDNSETIPKVSFLICKISDFSPLFRCCDQLLLKATDKTWPKHDLENFLRTKFHFFGTFRELNSISSGTRFLKRLLLKNWPSKASFSIFSSFQYSKQMLNVNFANGWIQTVDLWCGSNRSAN